MTDAFKPYVVPKYHTIGVVDGEAPSGVRVVTSRQHERRFNGGRVCFVHRLPYRWLL